MRVHTSLNILILFVCFGASSIASAGNGSRKKGSLAISIRDAMDRSNDDQNKIRIRFDEEADDRIDGWTSRNRDVIEIKHTGTTSIEPIDLGDPDFSLEELGEDQSGLDGLRSKIIEEESTEINFDEELREVSSTKN